MPFLCIHHSSCSLTDNKPSLYFHSLTSLISLRPEAQKLPYYSSYGRARLAIHTLCTSHYLDLVITFIICINVITMSLEHYSQPQVMALIDEDGGIETDVVEVVVERIHCYRHSVRLLL